MVAVQEFQTAADAVAEANNVVVVGHIRPDADAIGSVSAVVMALKQLGKNASGWIGQPEAFAKNLLSIPAARGVQVASILPEADLIVVVDCGSIDRTGAFADDILARISAGTPVIVVDHHDSNPAYGSINLIDPIAESTTTVLFEWFAILGVTLTEDIAHALYAGLVTDTGSFRWGRPQMHKMAADLVTYGINTRQIAAELIDHTSVEGLRMIGQALANIQLHRVGTRTVAVLHAPYEDIKGLDTSEVESLVDFVRAVEEADIGAVFKEYRKDWFAVSLRTSKDINVAEIAGALGGGGHLRAAGYTTAGAFAENLRRLAEVVEELE